MALQQIQTTRGLPLVLYGDRFGAFVGNDDRGSLEKQLAGQQWPTQLGQVFENLGITHILVGAPQAKGRIERLWGTLRPAAALASPYRPPFGDGIGRKARANLTSPRVRSV